MQRASDRQDRVARPLALLAAYAISVAVRAWHNPSGAHGQRQMDTGGMSLALALDLHREGLSAFWHSLAYPRILDRGLTSGINASELPLLAVMTAPFFLLGPHWGSFLSCLLIALANALAAAWALPRLLRAWDAGLPRWLSAVLYVAIGSVAFQVPILMPEGLSFPLLVIGSAWLCEPPRLGLRPAIAGALTLSAAVAVKPTAVVGLLVPALHPLLRKGADRAPSRERLRRALPVWGALAAALAFPAWWYAVHAREILARADGPQVFALARLAPLEKLREVGVSGVVGLVARQLNEWQLPFYCGALWVALGLWRERALLAALVVALVGAIALDGAHIWPHFYYFYGAGLVSLVLVARALRGIRDDADREDASRARRWVAAAALATLVWGALYSIRGNVWVTARTPDWWSLAARARPAIPEDAHLVTDDEVDPSKLFWIGRLGTKAGSRAGWICQRERYRGLRLAILMDPEHSAQAQQAHAPCLAGNPRIFETAAGRWELWLYTPEGR